jgi:hypothetical protein
MLSSRCADVNAKANSWAYISVLFYACYSNCLETVRVLLQHGASLLEDRSEETSLIFEALPQSVEEEIINLLISTLASRRNQLSELAKATLPDEVLSDLVLEDNKILDARAFEVYGAISGRIPLSTELSVEYFSIKHTTVL